MGYILTLLLVVLLSLMVTRIAAVALTFTGLAREVARFQARSAFSTVGFATSEAEAVMNHPVRRRIIMLLMLLGNAGMVTIIATAMASFTVSDGSTLGIKLGVLACGLAVLWLIAMSKWIDNQIFRLVSRALQRFTELDAHDFVDLLHLSHGYSVTEMPVEEGQWLAGKRLDQLRLSVAGVNVLGITRADGHFAGTPIGSTMILPGDKLLLFGVRDDVVALDRLRVDPEGAARFQEAVDSRRTDGP